MLIANLFSYTAPRFIGGGAKSYDSALRRAWSYTFWKIFGASEKVACDVQLFTGICLLKDTLNRSRLANTGIDVIAYLKDLMSVYW